MKVMFYYESRSPFHRNSGIFILEHFQRYRHIIISNLKKLKKKKIIKWAVLRSIIVIRYSYLRGYFMRYLLRHLNLTFAL